MFAVRTALVSRSLVRASQHGASCSSLWTTQRCHRTKLSCVTRPRPAHASLNVGSGRRYLTIDSTAQSRGDKHDTSSQEHALISTFDLFSIGIGPSSSHTVGPMRAGNIFVEELIEANLLHKVSRIRIAIYGSLALTGEGHMTPSALLLGLEGADIETVDTSYVPARFAEIKDTKKLRLGSSSSSQEIDFDYSRDFVWQWTRKLPLHSNGMRFAVFDQNGDPIATNDLYSIGGGFVVNGGMEVDRTLPQAESRDGDTSADSTNYADVNEAVSLAQNPFYKKAIHLDDSVIAESGHAGVESGADAESGNVIVQGQAANENKDSTHSPEDTRQVPYHFHNASSLLALCKQHNLTIAQLMYENEKGLGYTDDEIFHKLFSLWDVMDNCIREGVQAPLNSVLPGSLQLRRRAPALYQRLTRGLYPEQPRVGRVESLQAPKASGMLSGPSEDADGNPKTDNIPVGRMNVQRRSRPRPPRLQGSPEHPISLVPVRSTTHPAMDYLTVYAIAVNETNAAGGRVVTAPTNGAAGIIPAVLKYVAEFVSDDPERDIPIFLLTAAAIASLYKRGATISAAEGGCMAEVGVACSMAAAAYAACMGAGPETIEQAAEIGIEHNLGLTCDPIGGLVQAPCIERNALGAIKAISSANLALNSVAGTQKVRLDDAIRAMRLTAKGMQDEFKETSLSGLATSVPINIPVSVPDC